MIHQIMNNKMVVSLKTGKADIFGADFSPMCGLKYYLESVDKRLNQFNVGLLHFDKFSFKILSPFPFGIQITFK